MTESENERSGQKDSASIMEPYCQSRTKRELVFHRPDAPSTPRKLKRSVEKAIDAIDTAIATNDSHVVMLWPWSPENVASFFSLHCVQYLESADVISRRAIQFPYRRTASRSQKTLLVDYESICDAVMPALRRSFRQSVFENPKIGYVKALHSLKHLDESGKSTRRLKAQLKKDPSLIHPSLFELIPQVSIRNDVVSVYRPQFLRRLVKKTWIANMEGHLDAATDLNKSPFSLVGLDQGIEPKRAFKRIAEKFGGEWNQALEIIIIDLTRRSRNTLGRDWFKKVKEFLNTAKDEFGGAMPPVIAYTDDPFVALTVKGKILAKYDASRKRAKPGACRINLTLEPNIDPDPVGKNCSGNYPSPKFKATSYGNDILDLVRTALHLEKVTNREGNYELSEALRDSRLVLQNLTALPGYPADIYEFLDTHYSDFERQYLGRQYDYRAPLSGVVDVLRAGLGGSTTEQIKNFVDRYTSMCESTTESPPGKTRFDTLVRRLFDEGEPALVVFPNELLRGFAEWQVEKYQVLPDANALEIKRIQFLDIKEASDKNSLESVDVEMPNSAVLIEPYIDQLFKYLSQRRLPNSIEIIASLAKIDLYVRYISAFLNLGGIDIFNRRVQVLQKGLEEEFEGRQTKIPRIDEEEVPEFWGASLDFTSRDHSNGEKRRIITNGGLEIFANANTEFAVYEQESIYTFRKIKAEDIEAGDQIFVPTPDFLDTAKEGLDLSINASKVLQQYHAAVARKVKELPGQGISDKAAYLYRKLCSESFKTPLPDVISVRRWIDVQPLLDVPASELRPHAPRYEEHFMKFMQLIGFSDLEAKSYWRWGIFWTRSIRIRRGAQFHEIFMGVLIDPEATISQMPGDRKKDVWKINELAAHYVFTVQGVSKVESNEIR